MFKQSLLSGLLLCGVVNAGTMGCNAEGVTVPCAHQAWDVGITALYLKPTSSLLNPYIRSGVVTEVAHYHNVKSSWDWAFLLEGSYHFNTGNDINLNWLHFTEDHDDVVNSVFPETAFGIIRRATDLRLKTKVDVVNFEFAQNSHLGSKTDFRVHGGLQYAYAKNNRDIQEYEQIASFPTFLFQTTSLNTKFNGVGPRLGADISRRLPHGFAVFAKGAMALLIGESKTKLAGDNISGPLHRPFNRYSSQDRLVPELETKLGASYQFNANMGQLSLLAGWMFQHYFNIFYVPPGEAIQNQFSSYPTSHNLSLNGPFVQGKWVADI